MHLALTKRHKEKILLETVSANGFNGRSRKLEKMGVTILMPTNTSIINLLVIYKFLHIILLNIV